MGLVFLPYFVVYFYGKSRGKIPCHMDCLGYILYNASFYGGKAWVNPLRGRPYLSAIGTSKAEVHCASFGIPLRVIRCKASCRGGPDTPRGPTTQKSWMFRSDPVGQPPPPKKKVVFVKSLKAGPGISSGFLKCTCINTACTWLFLYHLIPEKVHEVSSLSKNNEEPKPSLNKNPEEKKHLQHVSHHHNLIHSRYLDGS